MIIIITIISNNNDNDKQKQYNNSTLLWRLNVLSGPREPTPTPARGLRQNFKVRIYNSGI